MAVGDGRRLQYRWRRGDGTTEAAQCAPTCRPNGRRARQCRRLACGRHVREFARVAPRCRVGAYPADDTGTHMDTPQRMQMDSADEYFKRRPHSSVPVPLPRESAWMLALVLSPQHLSPHGVNARLSDARITQRPGRRKRVNMSAVFRPRLFHESWDARAHPLRRTLSPHGRRECTAEQPRECALLRAHDHAGG